MLAEFFEQLERSPSGKRVRASAHLARMYGDPNIDDERQNDATHEGEDLGEKPMGWRSAKEVVAFLRKRGAKIPTLGRRIEDEWAALSSEGEGEGSAVGDSDAVERAD
jgi:glycerol-3-phosphate O-acyltransferase/dihydroxyacetone phosphate acyltransferase